MRVDLELLKLRASTGVDRDVLELLRVVEIRRDSARVGVGEIFFQKFFFSKYFFFQNFFSERRWGIPGSLVWVWVFRAHWAPLEKRGPIRRGLWKGPSSCTS